MHWSSRMIGRWTTWALGIATNGSKRHRVGGWIAKEANRAWTWRTGQCQTYTKGLSVRLPRSGGILPKPGMRSPFQASTRLDCPYATSSLPSMRKIDRPVSYKQVRCVLFLLSKRWTQTRSACVHDARVRSCIGAWPATEAGLFCLVPCPACRL